MRRLRRWFGLRQIAMLLSMVPLAAVFVSAQMAPTRTWEELKQETQRRVDKNLGPVGGLKSEDAREALSNIHSLDRDEWAAAWSAIGERYEKRAKSEEAARNNDAARDDYFWAFRYYTVARWPVPNSMGKQKAYQNALAAFRNYGRFLDPPIEILHIPFEGKEITGYIRLPKDVSPAPVIFMINGTDSRKEDEVQGHDSMFSRGIGVVAIDMPGTGESPVKADIGSERIFSRTLDYLATRPDVDSKRIVAWGVSYAGVIGRQALLTKSGRACVGPLCRVDRCTTITRRSGRRNLSARRNTCSIYSRRAPLFTASSRSMNFMPSDRDCR